MSTVENRSQLCLASEPRVQNTKSIFFNIGKKTLQREHVLKCYQHDQNLKLSVSKLSEDQVKSSQMYGHLLSKIQKLQASNTAAVQQHTRAMKQLDTIIQSKKQNIHGHKFSVWELRNQIMNLEEQLADQLQECHDIGNWLTQQQQEQGEQGDEEQGDNEQEYNQMDSRIYQNQQDNEGQQYEQQDVGNQNHYSHNYSHQRCQIDNNLMPQYQQSQLRQLRLSKLQEYLLQRSRDQYQQSEQQEQQQDQQPQLQSQEAEKQLCSRGNKLYRSVGPLLRQMEMSCSQA